MLSMAIRWLLDRPKPSDERMLADCFGWCSEAMAPHYDRVAAVWQGAPLRPGDHLYHVLKNCLTEWIRLDAQRAMKAVTALVALLLLAMLLRELVPALRRALGRAAR
jgi:hypothetical protein